MSQQAVIIVVGIVISGRGTKAFSDVVCDNPSNSFCTVPAAGQSLLAQFPGLAHQCECSVDFGSAGIRTYYGKPMGAGTDATIEELNHPNCRIWQVCTGRFQLHLTGRCGRLTAHSD